MTLRPKFTRIDRGDCPAAMTSMLRLLYPLRIVFRAVFTMESTYSPADVEQQGAGTGVGDAGQRLVHDIHGAFGIDDADDGREQNTIPDLRNGR